MITIDTVITMKSTSNCENESNNQQWLSYITLLLRHNEHDGVSNHRRLDCLLNDLFRRRSKKTTKLRVTGLCEGNPRKKDQQRRKSFHFMTSSWSPLSQPQTVTLPVNKNNYNCSENVPIFQTFHEIVREVWVEYVWYITVSSLELHGVSNHQ